MMTELIKTTAVTIGKEVVNAVNARDLWKFLEIGRDFSNWLKGRIHEYGFEDGKDFSPILAKSNGRPRREYFISLDMAKELAMVENNEKGRQARRYFIEIEKCYRQGAAPEADIIRSIIDAAISAQNDSVRNVIEENYRLRLQNNILSAFAPKCGIENLGRSGKRKYRRGAEVKDTGTGKSIYALINMSIQLELPLDRVGLLQITANR